MNYKMQLLILSKEL